MVKLEGLWKHFRRLLHQSEKAKEALVLTRLINTFTKSPLNNMLFHNRHMHHVVANHIRCLTPLHILPFANFPNKYICCTVSSKLKQKTQNVSWILAITPLWYKASLVGNFSSNNLQLKMITFDGTLIRVIDCNDWIWAGLL
jgi:hypothetical protein